MQRRTRLFRFPGAMKHADFGEQAFRIWDPNFGIEQMREDKSSDWQILGEL